MKILDNRNGYVIALQKRRNSRRIVIFSPKGEELAAYCTGVNSRAEAFAFFDRVSVLEKDVYTNFDWVKRTHQFLLREI